MIRKIRATLRHPLPISRSYLSCVGLTYRRPELARVVRAVRRRRLTYLRAANLVDLAAVVEGAENRGLKGSIIEAGTALGGSAIVLASAKSSGRRLLLHDVFGMIPPPTEADGADVKQRYAEILAGRSKGLGGDVYYGYRNDVRAQVESSLRDFGFDLQRDRISLIPGLFEETLRPDAPVAIAHIDCDWYQSVMTCLEAIEPWLVPGGRFVIDDYDHWSGCRRAVDEFFESGRRPGYRFERHSRLHVVKQ